MTKKDESLLANNELEKALELAREMGIDTESTPSLNTSDGNTRFTLPKGMRYAVTFFDSGKFDWNALDQEPDIKENFYKKAGDELIQMDFNGIGGYIVDFELLSRLGTYDEEDKKTKITCSVIGHMTEDVDTGKTIGIRRLPEVPVKGMYSCVNGSISYTTPDPMVTKLGLIGSRGETCEQCIRNGHSTMEIVTSKGPKTESCTPRGALYIMVHELYKVTKKAVKNKEPEEVINTYKVTDLVDEEGNPKAPFLLAINITSLTIRGAWNEDPKIVGYYHFITGLERQYKGKDPRRSPKFHFTKLTLRKKVDGQKYQIHFDMDTPNYEDMRIAHENWKAIKSDEVEIIPPEQYQGDTSIVSDNNISGITPVIMDDDDFNFDD